MMCFSGAPALWMTSAPLSLMTLLSPLQLCPSPSVLPPPRPAWFWKVPPSPASLGLRKPRAQSQAGADVQPSSSHCPLPSGSRPGADKGGAAPFTQGGSQRRLLVLGRRPFSPGCSELRWAGPGRKPWGKRQSPATVLLCDPRKRLPVWASSPVRWRGSVRCGKGLSWSSLLIFDTLRCEISGIVDEVEKQSHKTSRSKASVIWIKVGTGMFSVLYSHEVTYVGLLRKWDLLRISSSPFLPTWITSLPSQRRSLSTAGAEETGGSSC